MLVSVTPNKEREIILERKGIIYLNRIYLGLN
jgi:hypothetical protein